MQRNDAKFLFQESEKITEFPERPEGTVVKVGFRDLLNGLCRVASGVRVLVLACQGRITEKSGCDKNWGKSLRDKSVKKTK